MSKRTLLSHSHPEIAAQLADPSLAESLSSASRRKVGWTCERGHYYESRVDHRTCMGSSCPYCSRRKLLPGFNDLSTTNPDLAAELLDPELGRTLMPNANRHVEWKCVNSHVWSTTPNHRVGGGTGCPVCTGRVVVPGFNDLWTTRPDLAALLVKPEDGLIVTASSSKNVRWQCSCGHKYSMTVDVRANSLGCTKCSGGGFSNDKPGFLYLIVGVVHDRPSAQFGISHNYVTRLSKHQRNGYTPIPILLLHSEEGKQIRELETALKRTLAQSSSLSLTEHGMKFDGSTESIFVESDSDHEFLRLLLALPQGFQMPDSHSIRVVSSLHRNHPEVSLLPPWFADHLPDGDSC